jgi:uncharacterized ferritin-like protein (DUF455 family)
MRSRDFQYSSAYAPFRMAISKPDAIRALQAPGGVGDRLRVVAFAELQARDLFRYGAEHFGSEIPSEWSRSWNEFAEVEDQHAQLLLTRMAQLGLEPGERTVSDKLSRLCRAASDPVTFLFLLASAEERGMESGNVLGSQMAAVDAESAGIFARIAREEVEHVEHARAVLAPYAMPELNEKARALSAALQG